MSIAEISTVAFEGQGQELKLLSKALKSLDSAFLRFNKAIQDVQASVGTISAALHEVTACTSKLQLHNGVEEFNALCESIQACVTTVQEGDAARQATSGDSYEAVHKELEALRGRTELLSVCEKGWRKARDKCAKHNANGTASRKHTQYEARLGEMTTELRDLQRAYEYSLPNTLSQVLHRILRDSSQFCRSLGTTLLCCGNESRRYSETLLPPPSSSATSVPADATKAPLTDEQRKGIALQDFARDFFFNAPMMSRSFPSLSGFCGTDTDARGDGDETPGKASSSGCTKSRLLPAGKKTDDDDDCLWSPVDPVASCSILPITTVRPVSPSENVSIQALPSVSPTASEIKILTPEVNQLLGNLAFPAPPPPTEMHRGARLAVFRSRSQPPQKVRRSTIQSPPSVGQSLSTLGTLIQLEKDSDCPF